MDSVSDFDSLQEGRKCFWDVAEMEGNYIKIITRWCSFEEKKINNLWITAFLKQIFVRFSLILICTPTSCARPILVLLMKSNGLNLSSNMMVNLSICLKCSESTVSCWKGLLARNSNVKLCQDTAPMPATQISCFSHRGWRWYRS